MFKNKKAKFTKGFTLIELLVVIAIIGILSSVVLASLNTARGRGTDAKIKAQLSGLRAAAELFYDAQNPNSYNGSAGNMTGSCTTANSMFTDTTVAAYVTGTTGTGSTMSCYSTQAGYAVTATLPGAGGTKKWCVDSAGVSKQVTGSLSGITCPAS